MNPALTQFLRLSEEYPHLTSLLVGLLKGGLIVSLTLLLTGTLGRRSARTRSWAWRGAVVGFLGLAAWEFAPAPLTGLYPAWRLTLATMVSGVPTRPPGLNPTLFPAGTTVPLALPDGRSAAKLPSRVARMVEANVKGVCRAGTLAFALWHVLRVCAGTWWLKRSARPAGGRLQEKARDVAVAMGLPGAGSLVVCRELTTPLLVGWMRPTIYLPEESHAWSAAKLEAVLIHEWSHWQRRDGWWQTLAVLGTCLWWWHPGAWFVVGKLKLAAEQAADDAVVLRQGEAAAYAQTLVGMAASFAGRPCAAGVAMIGRSHLETRIRGVLGDNPWRGRQGKSGTLATITLLVLFLGMGGWSLRSADAGPPVPPVEVPPPATFTPAVMARGRVVNAQGQAIAGAVIKPYTEVRGRRWTLPAIHFEETSTDPDGLFIYSQPGYDQVGVMIVAPGYARKLVQVPYGNSPREFVLVEHGVEVTGRLLKAGNPVADVEVGIVQVDRSSMTFLDEITARTDQEGRFALKNVAPNDAYEVYGKRDSLGDLGVTGSKRVTTGVSDTTLSVGVLSVDPGIRVTGRIVLPDGNRPIPAEFTTLPDGRTLPNSLPVQLHVGRKGTGDYQYINLKPDLHFSFLAHDRDLLYLSAWVPGYTLQSPKEVLTVTATSDMPAVDMVYVPAKPAAEEAVP